MRSVYSFRLIAVVSIMMAAPCVLDAQESSPADPWPRFVVPKPILQSVKFAPVRAGSRQLEVRLQVLRLDKSLDVQFAFPASEPNQHDAIRPRFRSIPFAASEAMMGRLVAGGKAEWIADTLLRMPSGREGTLEIGGVFRSPTAAGKNGDRKPTRLKFSVTPMVVEAGDQVKLRMDLELRFVRTIVRDDKLPDEFREEYVQTQLEMSQGDSLVWVGSRQTEYLAVMTPAIVQDVKTSPLLKADQTLDAGNASEGQSDSVTEEIRLLRKEVQSLRKWIEKQAGDD